MRSKENNVTPYELQRTTHIAREMVEKDSANELHAVYLMLAALLKHEADKCYELSRGANANGSGQVDLSK